MNGLRRKLFLLSWAAATAVLAAGAPRGPAGVGEDERLTRFLDRLGLTDLEVVHLETVLEESELAPDRRVAVAKSLADLYAAQMMAYRDDPQRSGQILQRIESLVRTFPQAQSPLLEVMLLEADYNHAEGLATRWIADPTDEAGRAEANKILRRIAPELDGHQRALNARADALVDALDNAKEGEDVAAKEKELARIAAVAGRAAYFAGWSAYYRGLTESRPSAGEFDGACRIFRKLLEVEDQAYDQLDAEWLGLESLWRARAVIGLGLAEAARGNVEGSRACFALLDDPTVPPDIQDQASYWFVQGLLNAGRYDAAKAYAEKRIATYDENATQGKVSLCAALVRAAFAQSASNAVESQRQLATVGLEGLVRLGQLRAAAQLIERYHIDLDSATTFFMRWMDGRQKLAVAQRTGADEDYQAAAARLTAALEASDANRHVRSAAQCRYALAWCHFQLGRFDQAGQLYERAVTGWKASDPQKAAQSAWMAFVAYQKLIKTAPRYTAAAIDVLNTLKREFPDHPYAKRADYYIKKLAGAGRSPRETITALERIPPGDPAYLSARYDICVLQHQLWSVASQDAKPVAGKAVLAAVEKYLSAAETDGDDGRKLKCRLLAVEVLLGASPVDPAAVAAQLDAAALLVERLPTSSAAAAEYHYRCLQLATQRGDDRSRRGHAEWLVQHAQGSVYETPALVIAAKAVDRRMESAADADRRALITEAYGLYSRLVDRLGDSPDAISASKNAKVANSKLAEYASQLDRHRIAAEILQRLLAAYPKEKSYLRRAGLAHFRDGQYSKALTHWRTLLSGLASGADDWYEAKYYQLRCLFEIDPAAAEKVLRQFQLLHPNIGNLDWRQRFSEFDGRLQ